MAIHIKPSHKGLLHKNLGVKQGEKIPASKLKVHEGDSAALKKRKVFAQNAKKWHHAQSGAVLPTAYSSAPRPQTSLQQIQPTLQESIIQKFNQQQTNLPVQFDPNDMSGAPVYADNPAISNDDRLSLGRQRGIIQEKAPEDMGGSYEPLPQEQKQRQPYDGRYGKAALAGLLAVDALLPNKKPRYPVVRPSLSYNEHPYGTGGSALYEQGGRISTSGYKADSPDNQEDTLRIPSNQITMKGVPHPVYGVDEAGNGQMMYPEQDYQFEGNYVDEYPIMKKGGKMRPHGQYISKSYQAGGTVKTPQEQEQEDIGFLNDVSPVFLKNPLPVGGAASQKNIKANIMPRRLQPKEIDYFNNFNRFVDSSGYKGSPKLNSQEFSKNLYSQYQQQNPSNLTYDQLIPMAQQEQFLQKDFDVDFAKRKAGADKAAQLQNAPITPYDGMYGPLTSQRNIPIAQQIDKVNSRVVRDTTLGYVPNTINKAGNPQTTKPIPKGAEIIETSEGKGYYDPTYGNFVKLKNGGTIKTFDQGVLIQYKKGSTHDLNSEEIQGLLSKGYKLKMV